MFLTRISIARPVFTTMMMLAIVIIGLFSFPRLPIEQMPDVDFPVVAVSVGYPGASPEAVESDIVEPLEDVIATIAGLDKVQAIARPGSALLIMIFDLEVDSTLAAQDVRDKVAQATGRLPENANTPVVMRFDPMARAVMSLAISGEGMSARDLTNLAEDEIAQRLLNIRGVGSADVIGGAGRQIDIEVDPDRLDTYAITMQEVVAAISADNRDIPAGSADYGRSTLSFQIEARMGAMEEFGEIVVARRGDQPIRLDQLADIRASETETRSRALLDGRPALAIDIIKSQGSNTVGLAREVRAEVERLNGGELPEGVRIEIVRDSAVEVEESMHSVQAMLIEGALLATAIVFLFLNSWRSTIITGLTLPISIIGTMTAIWALGFTLNMMTMMALSLAVGILIDDAIVVRENIMRHLHMGKSHRQAAEDGTNEIGLAVLATTLSIVAVFLPVAFMEGMIGRFFLQFGVTVSIAVLISLFVAFTLDPMMSSIWYDPSADHSTHKGRIWRMIDRFDRVFGRLADGYARILRICLRCGKRTVTAAVLAFAGSFALVPIVGVEFMPASDNGEFRVTLETPAGSSLDYTQAKAAQAARILANFPEVTRSYTTLASGMNGATTASITVRMVPASERGRTPRDMASPVREALGAIPGVTVAVGGGGGMGGSSSPIDISISGPSLARLSDMSEELMRRLSAIEGVADVETGLEEAQPILALRPDRQAMSDLGVTPQALGAALTPMLGGQNVGDWTDEDGNSWKLSVRMSEALRNHPEVLARLPVARASENTSMIRLSQLGEITMSRGPARIDRLDGQRTINITADLNGRTLGDVLPEVTAAMAAIDVPPGYSLSSGGDQQNLAESGGSALAALALAVIFIYLVLASQFESLLQPVAIMASLPLSLIGVMLGLLAGGTTLNIFSAIGFIMLMGLVVKNAILLVDNANQRQSEDGMNLYDALVAAGHTRFRPIVMTTLAMIFGMLPMALNLSGGSGENAPMAHAVIGGLISSTIMTLVVVPVAVIWCDAASRRVKALFPKGPDHH